MDLMESVRLALSGLRANKMRSLLTMLGIIIGISSVIAIVTVGNSMSNSITSSMAGLGANNIMIGLQTKTTEFGMSVSTSVAMPTGDDLISMDLIDEFETQFSSEVEAVSLSESVGNAKAQDGHLYANVSITGVNEGYGKANNIELVAGRFLNERDIEGAKSVAVVSEKLVSNMFKGDENPLGSEIKLYQKDEIRTYTIVGVYKYEASPMMFSTASEKDISTNLYMPITSAKKITGTESGYTNFTVATKQGVDSQAFSIKAQNYFNRFYGNNEQYMVMAISMESMLTQLNTMMDSLSIAIAVIAGISLLVGGIGVMNIMLVSVTERTREIGTRKALGAPNSAIRSQFIIESVITCLIGGVFGVLFGIALGGFGAFLLGFPAAPSGGIIVIAVSFSMVIGVFFGYYPANKAAKLDPIEALRYE